MTSGNGVCDSQCFVEDCHWDNGDCNQKCDFTGCHVSNWTNNICDENCNSIDCYWDGLDCPITVDNNSSVSFDFECSNNCTYTLLDDGYCQVPCLDDNYPFCQQFELLTDCTDCTEDGGYGCWYIYTIYDFVAADANIGITETDWCNVQDSWDLLQSTMNDYSIVCNNISYNPKYDVNVNGVVGLWELIYMVSKNFVPLYQINNIDCSFCLRNMTKYFL